MKRNNKKEKIIIAAVVIIVIIAAIAFAKLNTAGPTEGYQTILSITGENEVTVSWSSEDEYDGVVECDGKSIAAEMTEIRDGEYYRYSAVIEGVEPDKAYKYCVGDGENMSDKGQFSLDGLDSDEFAFMYVGDIQYQLRDRDYEIWGQNIAGAYEENDDVSFALFAGDMVDKAPDVDDWEAFFLNAEPVFSQIPLMSTVGNHETTITPKTYIQAMAVPDDGPVSEEFYSFDYGSCHFVSLNSCLFMDERKSQEGYAETVATVNEWLENDLKENDLQWTVVFMHHPMYPAVEDDDIYSEIRANWEEILKNADVDLVLCGHQHAYMRTAEIDGITYVMANSGEKRSYYVDDNTVLPDYVETLFEDDANYLRIDVTGDGLKINAYSMEGKQIDCFEITK